MGNASCKRKLLGDASVPATTAASEPFSASTIASATPTATAATPYLPAPAHIATADSASPNLTAEGST